MTQQEINQVVEAMELRPEYKNILRKCLNGDNEGVKKAIEELNQANLELNTKIADLANKVDNIQSDVFVIVDSLPTSNIKNKIYCVKDTTGGGTNNKYIEYIYIETTKTWEKVGEFQAAPNLSGYAKLNGSVFTGIVEFKNKVTLPANTIVDGKSVGTAEDFIFTLDDGSTITKSIRVISTTTNQTE